MKQTFNFKKLIQGVLKMYEQRKDRLIVWNITAYRDEFKQISGESMTIPKTKKIIKECINETYRYEYLNELPDKLIIISIIPPTFEELGISGNQSFKDIINTMINFYSRQGDMFISWNIKLLRDSFKEYTGNDLSTLEVESIISSCIRSSDIYEFYEVSSHILYSVKRELTERLKK